LISAKSEQAVTAPEIVTDLGTTGQTCGRRHVHMSRTASDISSKRLEGEQADIAFCQQLVALWI
jgi:hypothetical protein